ncbi:THUMP domain-containing class I SAM-dependent RNA methyltransferase [Pseudolactococcus plantarum]|uniref:RNA methyltransferase n=1 Tax=Pseudolactococcus plantarum TaxID=1365 RepID=A0A2A5RZL4_9LACT|nr:class I SAM-dependent RNA methyltransferase [Lactococcus plantarum]PCS06669.1 RNA methyltransferase [Lactococcus plantarum]HCN73991.1 class I SAM-dependent RNA methyltransferase [Lactococcus sp.]
MKNNFKLVATAAAGLESLTAKELRDLGIEVTLDDRSRVLFSGDKTTIATANLWLRTADRVKIIVGEFPAKTFDELFEGVYALEWEDLLPFGAKFPIAKAKAVKSDLHNEPSIQAITKKAVAKKLQEHYHRPENVPIPETGALFSIEVALHKNVATIMVDTTGESLFKRGYRVDKGGAPIKENMAAAIIMLTNWRANMTRPFVDPTCGSGTFCIEAALIGMNIAPGFNRDFAFEAWPWFESEIFEKVCEQAESQANYDAVLDISGFDVDGRMIKIAQENALEIGLDGIVSFKQMRLQDFHTEKLDGVLVSNPPYGERLGDEAAAFQLYQEMGETFKPLETWSKYILTSDLAFEAHYGSKATKKRKLYNGRLRTDLYQYFGKRIK